MSMNVVVLLYLVASVFSFRHSRALAPHHVHHGQPFWHGGHGNRDGDDRSVDIQAGRRSAPWPQLCAGGLVVGGGIGAVMAKRVEMTKMMNWFAFMHSMIGLAAVCIAVAAVVEPYAFGITQGRRDSRR